MATLIVGSSSSECKECDRAVNSANPGEKGHYIQLGYGSNNGKPGCGENWTAVEFVYIMTRPQIEAFAAWHPHLIGLPAKWVESGLKPQEGILWGQPELPQEILDLFDL